MPKYKYPTCRPRVSGWTDHPALFCRFQLFPRSQLRKKNLLTASISLPGDYCDVYLTHDSMSVRKAHNSGRNHERNVLDYYQSNIPLHYASPSFWVRPSDKVIEIGHEKAQSVIDSITNSYAAEGQPSNNPMLAPQGGPGPMGGQPFPPPPFGFPGIYLCLFSPMSIGATTRHMITLVSRNANFILSCSPGLPPPPFTMQGGPPNGPGGFLPRELPLPPVLPSSSLIFSHPSISLPRPPTFVVFLPPSQ